MPSLLTIKTGTENVKYGSFMIAEIFKFKKLWGKFEF